MKILSSFLLLLLTACFRDDPAKDLKTELRHATTVSELILACELAQKPWWTVRKPMQELPPEIGQFINLKKLDLSCNELNTLPMEFANLSKLEELNLFGNRFTEIPPVISQLNSLLILDMGANEVTKLSPELFKLVQLKELSLAFNKLSRLPEQIEALSNLESLNLMNNSLRQVFRQAENWSRFAAALNSKKMLQLIEKPNGYLKLLLWYPDLPNRPDATGRFKNLTLHRLLITSHESKTHSEKFTLLPFAFLTFSHDTSIFLPKAVNQFRGGIVNRFVEAYRNILDGVYLCFDRIVINGYFRLLNSPGGMVTWFRRLEPDKPLTKNQLLRFAYRATRRLYAFAAANKIQILENVDDERKHELAQTYLKKFEKAEGIFLIMKVREMAPVYDSLTPKTKPDTASPHLEKKFRYVSYYYFHIKDRKWGHVTIGISPHPPFATRIILNAHDWLAKRADQRSLYYKKCENCLIDFTDEKALQKLADTLNEGHLLTVCQRWAPRVMMSLTTEEIQASCLERQFFFCQTECCFNMLFRQPRHLNWVYQNLIDNTRQRLRPGTINTIFGKDRRGVKFKSMSVRIENPEYDLTVVNVWLGKNRVKIYDKGERVLRVEATINRPKELGLLKSLAAFPQYRRRLENMLRTFMDVWQAADQCRLSSESLEELQAPVIKDNTRLPGISLTNRRLMTVLGVTIEMAKQSIGFTSAELYAQVVDRLQNQAYTKSQLNYDLRKLKAKEIIDKVPASHRYRFSKNGIQRAVGLLVFRNEIIQPVLSTASLAKKPGRPPLLSYRDQLYRNIQIDLEALCIDYGLKKAA